MKRNNVTGLIEGLTYKYKENGKIDWKGMIPEQFLYVNPQFKERLEKKYNKPYSEIKVSEVQDNELVILLGGIRYIKTNLVTASENYAAVNCEIGFIKNQEEDIEQSFSDNACAHLSNTNSFGKLYLVEMGTNRAIARTLRAALGINIVSKEELPDKTEDESTHQNPNDPKVILQKKIEDMKYKFSDIKEKLIQSKKFPDASSYNSVNDIPNNIILYILERLNATR